MLAFSKFSFFLIVLPLQIFFICDQALANSCQVYPSEYAYNFGSVQSAESTSDNCRRYPQGLKQAVFTEQYIHCNGTKLQLTDSNFGSEQYNDDDYYKWPAVNSHHQLLFIFPTRVNLTTITLHYYSDSDRGLPRLRFFAVPDDFDIWELPTLSSRDVEVTAVPPSGELAGHRNVSVKVNFNTKKVLLFKLMFTTTMSYYAFAVSEVEFSNCNNTTNQSKGDDPTYSIAESVTTTSKGGMSSNSHFQEVSPHSGFATTYYYSHTTTKNYNTVTVHSSAETQLLTTGLVLATIIVLTVILIVITVLALFFRKSTQRKVEFDSSDSALCKETTQKLHPQSHHNPNDLYDQIQLSPLTGQTEVISKAETENTNSGTPHQPINDTERYKEAVPQPTCSNLKQTEVGKSTAEQSNYAFVNKMQKGNKYKKGKENTAAKKESAQSNECAVRNVEELYTAVQKRPKIIAVEGEEVASSIPPHTLEELYTAVVKKTTSNAAEDIPPVPPHTVEDLYTAIEKPSKHGALQDEEEAPPIPAHTIEELYTAVQKKPQAADEVKSLSIPPYKVE